MWQEQLLQTADGQILWAEAGEGPLLLFVHGGPGDEYRYLRPLAEPFTPKYHCVLFDQRGSGGSTLQNTEENTLHPDRFVGDIEALRAHLKAEKIYLVGHSWGAILALLYGVAHPERVAGAVLIGMGPLSRDMAVVARANLLKVLSPAERERYARLSEERRRAVGAGVEEQIRALNRDRIRLTARALLYDHTHLDDFVEDWLAAEPYRNWRANRLVGSQIDFDALWRLLPRLGAPVLVVYGYQDFEPITQAYQLQDRLPDAMLAFVNESGHLPWLEQPESVHRSIQAFLQRIDPS
jgi:proline iminopeptidase